uniref:Neuritin 1-like a n=1 Tax=Kryptolebias marmoratus TaxID=37003 RepID=A0A3Q2ZXT5_KRYMA
MFKQPTDGVTHLCHCYFMGRKLKRLGTASSLTLFVCFAVLSPCPVAAASPRRCHTIYKGFAQCLMALGDSLTDSFHDCANVAMAGCPEEAAAVWESLRQESKKMQFSGNLYDMCSNRNIHPAGSISPHGPLNQEEINQESLRGGAAHPAGLFLLVPLLSPLLLLLWWI